MGYNCCFPIAMFLEQPWNFNLRLDSTISLIYLGIFPTGVAWLLRFHILKKWVSISGPGSVFNSYIWSYSWIYIFKRNNYFKSFNRSCNCNNWFLFCKAFN